MLTIFNRRELITIEDTGKYMNICQLLEAEHIPRSTKFIGGGGMARRGSSHGYHQPLYRIYVHQNDYDRAVAVMQPALRNY